MKILLLGPQGSGKSTQARLLSDFLKVPVISTGDIFREIAPVNEMIKKILDEGRLVDDATTSKIVMDRLKQPDCKDGFILDGYPRNLEQIQLFDPKVDIVFYLDVPGEEVLKRLTKRGREDDTPERIQIRLDLYRKQTALLLDYYRNLRVLVEINAQGDIQSIQKAIRSKL